MSIPLRKLRAVYFNALVVSLVLCVGFCVAHAQGEAEKFFSEAGQLRSEQVEASSRKAIERYCEAGNLWRDARQLRQAAIAFRNAGEVLSLLGESTEALHYYTTALKLARRVRNPLEEATTLNRLSYLHFFDGNTKDAHKNCLAALRINRSLKDRTVEAEALSNLGEVFYSLGDLEKAQDNQQRALVIWKEVGIPRGQALALIALGYYYVNLGEPEKALQSYTDGLSQAQAGQDLAVETLALIAIGNTKRKFGEKQEALASFETAKKLAVRIGNKSALAMATGGIGYVSLDLGDYKKALEYMDEGTRIFENMGNEWGAAEGKLDLGRIHRVLGNDDKALESLAAALALFKSLSMPRLEALTLREIATIHHKRGDHLTALRIYQSSLKLMSLDKDKRHAAYMLNYIGMVHESLKNSSKALAYYRRALPLSRSAADPESEALTLYNMAHVERDRGNLVEAKRQIEGALAIAESQRSKVSSQDLRSSYFATVRNTFDLQVDVLMRMHNTNTRSELNAEAFAISEKARARTFLESLREAQANVREGVDRALLFRERKLNEAVNGKAQYQLQLLSAGKKDEATGVGKELDVLLAELARVRDEIRTASPRLADLKQPELLSLKEVQQRVLDGETVLLEYFLGDHRSYVWVVTRTTFFSFDLAPRAEIEASAKRLYYLITSFQPIYGESTADRIVRQKEANAAFPSEAALLSKLILGPLAGNLNKKNLVVVADGALQYIPFQLLTNPESGSFLINTHQISYSPSASTLALLQVEAGKRKPGLNSVAVLADPVFEGDDPRLKLTPEKTTDHLEIGQALRDVGISPDGVEIPRLIASGTEADGIMAVAPWRTGLKAVGFAANRERVLGPELSKYRIVHFATHGIINSDRPELSGIVLSLFDSEGRSQNGFLRLHDIYSLDLPADLVVLSACSTGLGKDVQGEGLIGLTRGFMYAGASGVIASLWKVDDDATAELMKHFYRGLFKKNLSPAAALREAQLKLSQHQRWQSPYYWAGFVLQGQYTQNERFIEPFPSLTQIALLAALGGLIVVAVPILIASRRRRRHN